jgi:excisionase family DNA binding protein
MEAELLTVPEAARFLRLSRSKTYSLVQRGEIPVLRIGASVRIPAAKLVAWIDARTESASA